MLFSTRAIPQTTASATTNSLSPTATPPSGLSAGAKGGIGVSLAIGILGMAGFLYFIFFVRKKKAESTDTSAEKGPEEQSHDAVEMPAKMVVELPGDGKHQHMYQSNY